MDPQRYFRPSERIIWMFEIGELEKKRRFIWATNSLLESTVLRPNPSIFFMVAEPRRLESSARRDKSGSSHERSGLKWILTK